MVYFLSYSSFVDPSKVLSSVLLPVCLQSTTPHQGLLTVFLSFPNNNAWNQAPCYLEHLYVTFMLSSQTQSRYFNNWWRQPEIVLMRAMLQRSPVHQLALSWTFSWKLKNWSEHHEPDEPSIIRIVSITILLPWSAWMTDNYWTTLLQLIVMYRKLYISNWRKFESPLILKSIHWHNCQQLLPPAEHL